MIKINKYNFEISIVMIFFNVSYMVDNYYNDRETFEIARIIVQSRYVAVQVNNFLACYVYVNVY